MDRSATSSRRTKSTFVPMSIFGDHTLHLGITSLFHYYFLKAETKSEILSQHLFPAVDASVLKHFYPAFLETMKEFKINYEETNVGMSSRKLESYSFETF